MTQKECPRCDGKGRVPDHSVLGPQEYYNPHKGISWPEKTCPNCGGSGEIGTPDN